MRRMQDELREAQSNLIREKKNAEMKAQRDKSSIDELEMRLSSYDNLTKSQLQQAEEDKTKIESIWVSFSNTAVCSI